jgi:hypothetical protein
MVYGIVLPTFLENICTQYYLGFIPKKLLGFYMINYGLWIDRQIISILVGG